MQPKPLVAAGSPDGDTIGVHGERIGILAMMRQWDSA
jgi:hypothetical protein